MKKERLIKWYDWIILPLAAIVVVIYVIFTANGFGENYYNPLSNALFAVLNIIVTVLIAYKISYFSTHSQSVAHQKKLARNSIRHIRGYLLSLQNLESLIEEKMEDIEANELFRQYLSEFRNHIQFIKNGILSSENDFRDIVGEEFEEENVVIEQMTVMLTELRSKYKKLKALQEETETTRGEEVEKLKKEIADVQKELQRQKSRLPFGETPFRLGPSASSSGVSATPFIRGEYQGPFKFRLIDGEGTGQITSSGSRSTGPGVKVPDDEGEIM